MPNVEGGVGVPEGEDHEFGVDADDALDVLSLFLDGVGVDRFIGGVAHFAFPVEEVTVVVSSHDQGVGQSHLVLVWDREGQQGQGKNHYKFDH